VLGWRLFLTLRSRREEAGFWIFALVSFGPVAQLFPFLYPFADRYLYFILPGLIGGALLAGRELLSGTGPEPHTGRALRVGLERGAVAAAVLMCVVFAFRSHERASIWRAPAFVLADAAKHYPDGVSASLLRAKRAAQVQDAEGAASEIRKAIARGYNRFEQLLQDPGFESVRYTEPFQAVVRKTAQMWIDAGKDWEDPTQLELRRIASAHAVRGEREQAVVLLRRALERGGPVDADIRAELIALGAAP
jgi:hypothetical protein